LTPEALAINQARLAHLASLGLDLHAKRVLEVGAGIGLLTHFFVERGCSVLVTDANPQNTAEIQRRHPNYHVEVLDLDRERDLSRFGSFDIVFCYGTLYHLAYPEEALASLARICDGQILVETAVALGRFSEIHFVKDFSGNNQAVGGVGCRPTRQWVLDALRRWFGHAYIARTQPDHPDYPTNWDLLDTRLLYRAVFVGSKQPLRQPDLVEVPPPLQPRCTRPIQRVP
jgi:SAM-dependent methyltransferase